MTVFGIDISHFQHGLDLARVKREGYSFVMVKATEQTEGGAMPSA